MASIPRDKDIRRAVQLALASGCTITCGRKHNRLRFPSGESVTIPCTPSDHRTVRNFQADVRRAFRTGEAA
jgi:hypothetical protein